MKYYTLSNTVGNFINQYDIDFSCIKGSTINKVNEVCRILALNKAVFSEPENEADYDDDDETDNDDEADNDDDDNNEKNIKNNEKDHKTKEIIIDNKSIGNNIMDDLHIVLKKVIISNNEELMNNTIKLMNTLLITNQEIKNTITNQENNINTTTNQENNINTETNYVETLDWIKKERVPLTLKIIKKLVANHLNMLLQFLKLVGTIGIG